MTDIAELHAPSKNRYESRIKTFLSINTYHSRPHPASQGGVLDPRLGNASGTGRAVRTTNQKPIEYDGSEQTVCNGRTWR